MSQDNLKINSLANFCTFAFLTAALPAKTSFYKRIRFRINPRLQDFKSRPFENCLVDFCTSALLIAWPFVLFLKKRGWFLELSEVQKCKSPLEIFHIVSTKHSNQLLDHNRSRFCPIILKLCQRCKSQFFPKNQNCCFVALLFCTFSLNKTRIKWLSVNCCLKIFHHITLIL